MGHSMADPAHGHYRTKEEVEEYRKRDPLVLVKNIMMTQKLAGEADFKQLEREIGEVVRAAVTFAEESPFPARSDLHADVLQE
jgi:pyruvate dehydrogenase E1 component alpha subunit